MRRFFIWAFIFLIADRALKSLALNGQSWKIWIFQFRLFENDQSVFSLPTGSVVALWTMSVGTIIIAWLLVRSWRQRHMSHAIAAGLMFLGAASNLFDRTTYGYVIDWAYFGPWWPVFNLADVMIVVGVAWYLWPKDRLTDSTS